MRPGADADLPRTGAGMVRALAPGWRYRIWLGEGEEIRTRKLAGVSGRGRMAKVVEQVATVSLRLRHDDGRAVVLVWANGKFDIGFAWTSCACDEHPGEHPAVVPRAVGAPEARALLKT